MYTTRNFKSKNEFKAAVQAWNERTAARAQGDSFADNLAKPVTYYQPGPFGGNEPRDGVLAFEGPHYPAPHSWYAQAIAKDGIVIEVK